ncbi:MAG: alpha/beta fold hydrolase [Moraxellaceae bacterium]|jgi:polyhydroxyalkanoate synthase|nr:alpha/beta fold hydrolase [Moraxellaceae bacterium]
MSTSLERGLRIVKTGSAFVNNAVQRRVNKQRFLQQDKTAHTIIYRDGLMTVKHYQPLDCASITIEGQEFKVRQKRFGTPLVLVPPLGVFAWIFDLMADRSMAKYFLAHGFDVYLIDWGAPSGDDRDVSLERYVTDWFPKAMKAIREHSGSEEQSLLGYCMGGLLALLYLAASRDAKVVNLVTIASPVDMHKMGFVGGVYRALSKPLWAVGRVTGIRIDKMQRDLFHVPGKRLSFMFKMTNPVGTISSYLELVRNLADDDYVSRYMTMNEWFTNMPDYPGATVQQLIRKMGLYNRLARGRIRLGGQDADFRNIRSALLAFAGDNDKIVPVASAEAILEVVSSTDKAFHIVPGGHAGVFTGGRAAHTTWAISKDWLTQRSAPLPRESDATE